MKPNKFFFQIINVLCASGMQLQILLFFLEPVTSLFAGRTTNCLLLAPQASQPCLFWKDFLALVDQKPLVIENYATLNKRNVPMWQITTLETWQVLFFCDAMHPGTCRHCKNGCWAGQLRKLSFLCQYSTNWGIYCFSWLQLPSTLIGHPHEKWWIFPLNSGWWLTCSASALVL